MKGTSTSLGIFLLAAGFGGVFQSIFADEIALTQTTQIGQTAIYIIDIHNDTTTTHTYDLKLTGLPQGLTAIFTQGGPRVENISVPPENYRQIMLKIKVLPDVTIGRYNLTFSAVRDDQLGITQPLILKIENSYALQITSQAQNINTFKGQEFVFNVTASNTGTAPLTNLRLDVNLPSPWVKQIDPFTIRRLSPNENAHFRVRVFVPATQVAIEEHFTFSVTSDQENSEQYSLKVRVRRRPSLFRYVGILGITTFIGAFSYFQVKRRR